jgi:predicted transcriptional regulator
MPEEPTTTSINQELTAEIVAGYVRRNQIGTDQLPSLIATVHQALANLGNPATEAPSDRKPAVSARQSVQPDYVVCMDCGWKGSMLRRHLTAAHGLTTDEYRARWNLKPDHPVTAPGYSERRSTMAKQFGLGLLRRGASVRTTPVPEAETATEPNPKPRGRPRKPSS